MVLEYWIWKDQKWQEVTYDEYYEYHGHKQITGPNRRGLYGWRLCASALAEMAGRHLV